MAGLERLLIGRTLDGRYVIEELVGSGRSGLVYRGRHARLGSELAVKVLTLPRKAETRERYRRLFRHEAAAAAALRHPNLPLVIGSGTDPELDLDFFVTELLEGERLSAVLSQRGRPPAALALRVFTDAVSGVAAGHAAGMLHRDLRPANLYLVRAQGEKQKRVRVMGFGVPQMMPRETMTSTDLGLIGYAPPEFFSGGRLTSVGDVFGLGSIGYELLAGAMPYDQQARRELAAGRMVKLDPHPELFAAPPHVAAAILRALRVDPAERFDDAQAFAAALADPSFADAEPPIAAAAPVVRPAIAVPIVVASAVAASESAAPEPAPVEPPIAIPQAEPIAVAEPEPPAAIAEPGPVAVVAAEAEPALSASTEVAGEAAEALESVEAAAESVAVAEIVAEPIVAAQVESPVSVDEVEAAPMVAASAVDTEPAAEAAPAPVYTPAPAPVDRFRMPPPAPRRDSPRDLELYYPEEKPAPEPASPIPGIVPAIAAAAVPASIPAPEPTAEPVAEAEPVAALEAPVEPVAEQAAEIEWEPTVFAPAETPRAAAPEPQTTLDLAEAARAEPAPQPILFVPSEPEAPAHAAPMPVPARRPFRVSPPSTRSRLRPSMIALVVVVVAVGSASWIAMHRPATANEGDPAVTAANQLAPGGAVPAEGAPPAPTADSATRAAASTPIQPLPEKAAAEEEKARPTPEERAAQARLAQQQLAAQQEAARVAAQTPPAQTPAQRPQTQPAAPPVQTAAAPQPAPAPPPAPAPREQLAASTEPARPAAPAVYDIAAVEQRPVLVNGPEVARTLQERYPRQLQQNRVSGRVTATFVVREDGSVDPSSIRVVDSPNSGFNSPTAAVLRRARFSPARVNGESVKVQVTMPVTWSVNE